MNKIDIPEECIDAMRQVYYGGFVFDITDANLLIYVQIKAPELIHIWDTEQPLTMKCKPIFCAMLSRKGKEYIDELL